MVNLRGTLSVVVLLTTLTVVSCEKGNPVSPSSVTRDTPGEVTITVVAPYPKCKFWGTHHNHQIQIIAQL